MLFEVWDRESYTHTACMVVDHKGAVVTPAQKLDYPIRLHRTDPPIKRGNDAIILCGEGTNRITTYTFDFS